MNPLTPDQWLALAAMAQRTGIGEEQLDILASIAQDPSHPHYEAVWEQLAQSGVQRATDIPYLGQAIPEGAESARLAAEAGAGWEAFYFENGLPSMGGWGREEPFRSYREGYEANLGWQSEYWRTGADADPNAYLRREQIFVSSMSPQQAQFTSQTYTATQLNLAKGGAYYINSQTVQARNAKGEFSSAVGNINELKSKLEAVVRQALQENYKKLSIGKTTGTLYESASQSIAEIAQSDDEGFVVTVTPKEMKREPRQNEPDQVSTSLYGSSIWLGHRAILPKKQRYLRFKLDQGSNKWITTRNVRQVAGKDIFVLDSTQIGKVRDAAVESYVAQLKQGLF